MTVTTPLLGALAGFGCFWTDGAVCEDSISASGASASIGGSLGTEDSTAAGSGVAGVADGIDADSDGGAIGAGVAGAGAEATGCSLLGRGGVTSMTGAGN